MPHELPIPPTAASDPKAREIARIWAACGAQHVALASGLWEDPASWGIMLVDLANHVANAYEQSAGLDRSEVLARIREGFDAEWESATDEARGGLLDEAPDA
jgi:hypothetical protein